MAQQVFPWQASSQKENTLVPSVGGFPKANKRQRLDDHSKLDCQGPPNERPRKSKPRQHSSHASRDDQPSTAHPLPSRPLEVIDLVGDDNIVPHQHVSKSQHFSGTAWGPFVPRSDPRLAGTRDNPLEIDPSPPPKPSALNAHAPPPPPPYQVAVSASTPPAPTGGAPHMADIRSTMECRLDKHAEASPRKSSRAPLGAPTGPRTLEIPLSPSRRPHGSRQSAPLIPNNASATAEDRWCDRSRCPSPLPLPPEPYAPSNPPIAIDQHHNHPPPLTQPQGPPPADPNNPTTDIVPIVEPPLCPEQAELVDLILNGRNVFYTGSAGCGKSTVLKAFVKRFRDMGKFVRIVAPTGRAALDINGSTTWTYAGWSPDSHKKPLKELKKAAHGKFVAKRFQETDVLVIDEISMVENLHFERLNAVMQEARGNDAAFGGVQLVVTGDFCQLPPVKPFGHCIECGRELVKNKAETEYTCRTHG